MKPEPPQNHQFYPVRQAKFYRFLQISGLLALPVFYGLLLRSRWVGYSDFDQIYLAGLAWRRGLSPYDGHLLPTFGVANGPTNEMLHAYYYSPLCGMLSAPLSWLPFPVAILLWKLVTYTVLLFAFWRFLRVICSAIPLPICWFLLGASSLAGSVRWNYVQLQPTALIVGLLLLFVCGLVEKKQRQSILLGVLISIKVTYLFPVVGLLLLRKEYRIGLLIGVITFLLNGISLLKTDPIRTLTTYRHALSTFEEPGKMTNPDALDFLRPYLLSHPDSPLSIREEPDKQTSDWPGEQIHFRFILSSFCLSRTQSQVIVNLLALGICLVLFGIGRRASLELRRNNHFYSGLFFVTLTAVSLLVVYHQRYDSLALLPCIFVAIHLIYQQPKNLRAWLLFASSFFLTWFLTGSMLERWQDSLVVPHGLLFLAPICGYLALMICLELFSLLIQNTVNKTDSTSTLQPSANSDL